MSNDKLNYALGRYGNFHTLKRAAELSLLSVEELVNKTFSQKQNNPYPKQIPHYCGGKLVKSEGMYACDNKKCLRNNHKLSGCQKLSPNTHEVDNVAPYSSKYSKVTYFVDPEFRITDVKYHLK